METRGTNGTCTSVVTIRPKINLRFHDASLTYSRLLRMRLVVALRFVRIWKNEQWIHIYIYICTILSYTHTERKTRARTVESEFRNRINNVERRGFRAMRTRSYFFFSFPRTLVTFVFPSITI